eukprot:m.20783 g.20783  ORF g.20783 m.20783 type:complete len:72 (+) comp28081_c0_seq1:152-367(+)
MAQQIVEILDYFTDFMTLFQLLLSCAKEMIKLLRATLILLALHLITMPTSSFIKMITISVLSLLIYKQLKE